MDRNLIQQLLSQGFLVVPGGGRAASLAPSLSPLAGLVPQNTHDVIVTGNHVYDGAGHIVPGAVTMHIKKLTETAVDFKVYARPSATTPVGCAAWAILLSVPTYYVTSGWAYGTGLNPTFETRHFTAGGKGTRFLVEFVDPTPNSYRVYLLNETPFSAVLNLTAIGTTYPLVTLDEPDTYTTVSVSGSTVTASPPAAIPLALMAQVHVWVAQANAVGVVP